MHRCLAGLTLEDDTPMWSLENASDSGDDQQLDFDSNASVCQYRGDFLSKDHEDQVRLYLNSNATFVLFYLLALSLNAHHNSQ